MKKTFNRRHFLGTAVAGAGAALLPRSVWSNPIGANEHIRIAVLGVGGRGKNHVDEFHKLPGVRLIAVADADLNHAKSVAEDNPDMKLDVYQDYRKVLERDDIDAVVIATPNHWHTPMTIHACQAGKDVFVEKPATHNLWEGKQLIEAAKKYDRIVQTGTQRRSDLGWHEAMAYLQTGELGKVILSRGLCYKDRDSIGKVEGPQDAPESVDYNLWSGPAEIQPIMRQQFHYDWHWQWPYGNGDLGNQGVHQTDVARWALGAMTLPKRIVSIGGRFGYDDDGETPNTQYAILEYDEGPMFFEVRGLRKDATYKVNPEHPAGVRVGNIIHCENGYIAEAGAYDLDGKRIKKFPFDGGGGHQQNFIDAMRSRKTEDLNADALEGHLSAAICHVANISHRLGSEASREEIAERFKGNDQALATLESLEKHLAENGIDLSQFKPVLGPVLEMDRENERFVGDHAEAANALLKGHYREEFAI